MKKLLINSLILALSMSGFSQTTTIDKKVAAKEIAASIEVQKEKLAFVKNKGQWPAYILYKADLPNGQAIVTKEGMLTGIFDASSLQALSQYSIDKKEWQKDKTLGQPAPIKPIIKGHGWKMRFAGSNPTAQQQITQMGESSDYYNYLGTANGKSVTHVHSYTEVVYKEVYKGVDVRYYGMPDNLGIENDIVVKPGADWGKVAIQIDGVDKYKVDAEGSLVLQTSLGEVKMPRPITYTVNAKGARTSIPASYRLNDDNSLSFKIGRYDISQSLVIDPIILRWATWATNNGATGGGSSQCIDVDKTGNIYIGGTYTDPNLITVGAFQSTNMGGGGEMFFGKYTEPTTPGGAGTRVWQTYLGGVNQDYASALTIAPDGNIYATGTTSSTLNTTYGTGFTSLGYTNRTGGTPDQFLIALIKLNPSGTGAQVRTMGTVGGLNNLQTASINIMPKAGGLFNIIVAGSGSVNTGYTASGDFPNLQTPSGTAIFSMVEQTFFGLVLNLTSDFSTTNWIKMYSTTASGGDYLQINCAALDASNNIYLGGITGAATQISYNNPSTQTALVGTWDGWLMQLNASGTVLFSRYFNSTSAAANTSINAINIAPDNSDMVIGGNTQGLTAANIMGGYNTTFNGNTNMFVARLPKNAATTTWGTYLPSGGSGQDVLYGLAQDANKNIYILGAVGGPNYAMVANPIQGRMLSSGLSYTNNVISQLSANGTTLLYSSYLGGSNYGASGYNCLKLTKSHIYLLMGSASNDFPLTDNSVTTNRTSSNSSYEPVLVSLSTPPDFDGFTIAPAMQVVSCRNGTPQPITATAPTYKIPAITRNGTVQSIGTAMAYPNGVPTITSASFQWQNSIDSGKSWTNIIGATALTLTTQQMGTVAQNTWYQLSVNGDGSSSSTAPTALVTVGNDPTAAPSSSCFGNNTTIIANAIGSGPLTYSWVYPPASTRGTPPTTSSITLVDRVSSDAGMYQLTVTNAGGCQTTKAYWLNTDMCVFTTVLPVTLASFNAVKDNSGAKVLVNWISTSEVNFDHYEVERSADGVHYDKIGSVMAKNSAGTNSYAFIDVAPSSGLNYYRLLLVDKDGTAKYSDVKTVTFDKSIVSLSLYPNPVHNLLTISGTQAGMLLRLVSMDGRVINTTTTTGVSYQFAVQTLAAGTYMVQVWYNGAVLQNLKFIKQ